MYLTSTPGSTWVLDTGSVTIIGDLKQKLRTKRRLAKGEVMMCVGSDSKVDKITSFKKRAKGRRGTSIRTASKLLLK